MLQMQRTSSMLYCKNKNHLIRNGREPTFRVWRGPGKRDDSDEEWEQEFKRPSRPHDKHINEGLDMHAMLKLGSRAFKLWAVLLWTIHDFPGYGTGAGVAHQGYAACLVCGPDFKGEHCVELAKQSYIDTRWWLAHDDPWRSPGMKDHFNGRIELWGKPKRVTANEQVQRATKYQTWLDEGNKEGTVGDPSKTHGVKRRSILHNLPYWKVNDATLLTLDYCMYRQRSGMYNQSQSKERLNVLTDGINMCSCHELVVVKQSQNSRLRYMWVYEGT